MASSVHKIRAIDSGSHPVFGDFEQEYDITFTFYPAEGATALCPGAKPGIEFVKVDPAVAFDGSVSHPDLMQARIDQWAEDWLEDHYDECVASAQDDRAGEADDHADYLRRERRDLRLTGEW